MKITFRKLTDSDINTCLSIVHENYPQDDKLWDNVLRNDVSDAMNKKYPSEFILIMRDEIIIGFGCYMSIIPLNLYRLSWINILPSEQGNGFGKMLVGELERCVNQENKKDFTITLETDKPLFYKKLGYVTTAKYDISTIMKKNFVKLKKP